MDSLPVDYLSDPTGARPIPVDSGSRRVPGLAPHNGHPLGDRTQRQPTHDQRIDTRPPLPRGASYAAAAARATATARGTGRPDSTRGPQGDVANEGDDGNDGFVGASGLSRNQRRKMARRGAATTASSNPQQQQQQQHPGQPSHHHRQLHQDHHDEGGPELPAPSTNGGARHQQDHAPAREAPFSEPPLSRAQLITRVDALELQGRQLAERRASHEEQRRHADILEEARRMLKLAGGYEAQKLQFELLGEQRRMRKAHAQLRKQEEELQDKEKQMHELAASADELRQSMEKARARISYSEDRAAYLALQVGALGQRQFEVAQVHFAINEAKSMAAHLPEGVYERLDFVSNYLRRVAPLLQPPACDPVVANAADVYSNQCSDTDLDCDDDGLDHDVQQDEQMDVADDQGADGEFAMPAHIDIVRSDLRILQEQFDHAQREARGRGCELLPSVLASFQEKLQVAESRVAAAEQVLQAQCEVEAFLRHHPAEPVPHHHHVPPLPPNELGTCTAPTTPPSPTSPPGAILPLSLPTGGPPAAAARNAGGADDLLADGAVDIVERAIACKAIEDDNRRLSRRLGDRRPMQDAAAHRRARSDEGHMDVDAERQPRPRSLDHGSAGSPRRTSLPRKAARRERTPRGRPRDSRNVEAARAYRRACEEAGDLVVLD